jgi:hypothetical protein
MQAQKLIEMAGAAAQASGLVDGLFLAGSFGRGTADDWSDVDLVGLAPAERHDAVTAWWRKWLNAQETLIYWKQWGRGGTLTNAITESWLRVDLHLPGDGQLGERSQDGVRPLYDPENLHSRLMPSLPAHRPDARAVAEMIEEFIRILGLTPVGLGRKEYVIMAMGAGMLRDLLSRLMQEELPIADRGGLLHLNKLLPPQDIAVLEALPYPGPERNALVEGQLAVARVFFPRAKRLAAELGMAWPGVFERSAQAHLANAIGRDAETLWPI